MSEVCNTNTQSVLVLRERNWYYHDPARENLFMKFVILWISSSPKRPGSHAEPHAAVKNADFSSKRTSFDPPPSQTNIVRLKQNAGNWRPPLTVRYPERFENDFKGGQPGCLDPFSSSVNGVPGYPDRFWIQFSMAKKNSSQLFTCRACSLSGAFRLILFSILFTFTFSPSLVKNNFSTDRYRYRQFY